MTTVQNHIESGIYYNMPSLIQKSLVCHCCTSNDVFVCCNKNEKHLLHCLNCGVYFFYERPTQEELSSHYRGQYSLQHREQLFSMLKDRYDNGYFKNEAQSHLHYLNMPPIKVLDYGSSYGFYLKAMKELGVEVYGVEYDKDIVGYNRRELGITMIDPGELETLESDSFDIVRAYHTLEHLPDPRGILSKFFRILRKNGILLISTPCLTESIVQTNVIKVPDMVYPEHLFYFTTKAMFEVLTQIGYKVEINISQFANPSQALSVLGTKGDFDTNTLDHIVKGLEGIGAGVNSFAIARKTASSDSSNSNYLEKPQYPVHIYTLQQGQRGSHHIIKQDGLWGVEYPVKRNSSGGRIFVSGNIIVLRADYQLYIQLIDVVSNQPQSNKSGSLNDNEMRSFIFYNDVTGKNDQCVRISGNNPSEFILYDLNCSEISFESSNPAC